MKKLNALILATSLTFLSSLVSGCGPKATYDLISLTSPTIITKNVEFAVKPYTPQVDITKGAGKDLWDHSQNNSFLLSISNKSIEPISVQSALISLVDSLGNQYNTTFPKVSSIESKAMFSTAFIQGLTQSRFEQAISDATGQTDKTRNQLIRTVVEPWIYKTDTIMPAATVTGVVVFAPIKGQASKATFYLPGVKQGSGEPATLSWEFGLEWK